MIPCSRMNSETERLMICCDAFKSRFKLSMAGKKIFAAIPAVREAMHTNKNALFLRAFDHFRGSSSTVSRCRDCTRFWL